MRTEFLPEACFSFGAELRFELLPCAVEDGLSPFALKEFVRALAGGGGKLRGFDVFVYTTAATFFGRGIAADIAGKIMKAAFQQIANTTPRGIRLGEKTAANDDVNEETLAHVFGLGGREAHVTQDSEDGTVVRAAELFECKLAGSIVASIASRADDGPQRSRPTVVSGRRDRNHTIKDASRRGWCEQVTSEVKKFTL